MRLNKKIVFSDYDGTIYITEESILKNIKAIEEYRKLGGKFVITTGRSIISLNNVIKKYNIQYDYIIANNGAVIYNSNMVKIYEQTIKQNLSNKIIDYLNTKENIQILFYDDDDKVEYRNQELLKLQVRTSNYELAQTIEDEINSIFKEDVKAHSSFPSMYYENENFVIIDIVLKTAGKENAIKQLLEMLNIEKDEAVTIGDGRNDIEMIKEYNGYSLETAKEEVKSVASKIFESVADALENLKNVN